METSQDIKEIAVALVKVQGAIGKAKKDSQNPHFNSKYADLTAVWDACHAALQAAEVAVIQGPGVDDNGNAFVETMLLHKSGQFIKSRAIAKPIRLDPQAIGSASTYLRRYGLAAMVGVVQEDDDGNGGSETPKKAHETHSNLSPKTQPKATRGVEAIKQIDPVASGDTADTLIEQINGIMTKEGLDKWKIDNKFVVDSLSPKLRTNVLGEYARRNDQFKDIAAEGKAA